MLLLVVALEGSFRAVTSLRRECNSKRKELLDRILELEKEAALKTLSTEFHLTITGLLIWEVSDPFATRVRALVEIRNGGKSSVAKDWKLSATPLGSQGEIVARFIQGRSPTIPGRDLPQVLSLSESISNTPLITHGKLAGELYFVFSGLVQEKITDPNTLFRLVVCDSENRSIC